MANLLFETLGRTGLNAWRKCRKNTLAWVCVLMAITASGHPEYSIQVEEITTRIEQEPINAHLYLHRADLHRQAHRFDLALADVATAARLKRDWPLVSLVRGEIQFDAGHPEDALKSVEQFLRSETNHAPALLLRAHCHRQLGLPELAVADYDAGLQIFAQPNPDWFIERARLEAALGRFDKAIEGLEEGMNRLGVVPGLQLAAIELERQTGRFDAALRRINKMAKGGSNTPAEWLLKAEVLEQAGRLTSAREAFQNVVAPSAGPGVHRDTELTQALRQKAREGLERVQQRLSSS